MNLTNFLPFSEVSFSIFFKQQFFFCVDHLENNNLISFKVQQEVQGLQAFAFSVVTVNDEHRKPGFKVKCKG